MRFTARKELSCLLSLLLVMNPILMVGCSKNAGQKIVEAKQEGSAREEAAAEAATQDKSDTRADTGKGGEERPAQKEPTAEDLKKMADEMEKAFKALEAAEKEIPRDTFDPKAIVEKVGTEPDKLFEWVRDKTFWVPYQGSLRGPIGVLMDRLGSNCDRALLLAELLNTAGHKVRLAHATLAEAQAKELLSKLRPVPRNPLPPTPPASKKDLDQLIEKYAKEYGLDAAEMRKNMDKASLQAAKLSEDIVQRVADQVPRILKAVGHPSEKDVQALRAREAAAELAALRDHWWVQRQDGNIWVDLDPLLPDAEPGKALAKAKEIIPDKEGKLVLPSKHCHEVIIHVVIEKWEKNKVTEHAVLEHALRPSDLFGERIALAHIPMHWPKDLDLFKEKEPLKKLKSIVMAETEWLPVLMVGGKPIAKSSFSDTGAIYKEALAPLAGGLEKGVQGFDPFKRAKESVEPSKKPRAQGHLTAEWIDYEIRSPGRPAEKIRRQIFDLLGPAARAEKKVRETSMDDARRMDRALPLLGQIEILPLVCELPPDYVGHLAIKNALANRNTLLAFLRQADKADFKTLNIEGGKLSRFSDQLYALAITRHALSRARTKEIYLDRPGILSHHEYLRHGKGDNLLACEAFDIVANDVAVRAAPDADPFLTRLEQGVLDTNAEALLLTGCSKVENVAQLFAAPNGPREEWFTIRSVRDAAWQEADLPKDIRAQIEQELAAGYAVVVPKKPLLQDGSACLCWWRVNPITGQTLGIGERGWGQTTAEKLTLIAIVTLGVFVVCAFKKLITTGKFEDRSVDAFNCLCKGAASGAATAFALWGWNRVAGVIVAGLFAGFCS